MMPNTPLEPREFTGIGSEGSLGLWAIPRPGLQIRKPG